MPIPLACQQFCQQLFAWQQQSSPSSLGYLNLKFKFRAHIQGPKPKPTCLCWRMYLRIALRFLASMACCTRPMRPILWGCTPGTNFESNSKTAATQTFVTFCYSNFYAICWWLLCYRRHGNYTVLTHIQYCMYRCMDTLYITGPYLCFAVCSLLLLKNRLCLDTSKSYITRINNNILLK